MTKRLANKVTMMSGGKNCEICGIWIGERRLKVFILYLAFFEIF